MRDRCSVEAGARHSVQHIRTQTDVHARSETQPNGVGQRLHRSKAKGAPPVEPARLIFDDGLIGNAVGGTDE
jgi:hypothetical protein